MGISIALISDSALDYLRPGSDLVCICKDNIKVFLCLVLRHLASLVLSNFSKTSFSFKFFPRQKKDALKEIELIKKSDCPIYESPKE